MSGKVRGVVCVLGETQTFGASGFRKRGLVLEQDKGRFTNFIPLDFTRDACDTADDIRVGDEIEVKYTLGGRKWEKDGGDTRYFLSAEVVDFTIVREGRPSRSRQPESRRRDDDDDVAF